MLDSSELPSDGGRFHYTLISQSCYSILATYSLSTFLCFSNRLENNDKKLEKEVKLFFCSKSPHILEESWFNLKTVWGESQKKYLRGPNLC